MQFFTTIERIEESGLRKTEWRYWNKGGMKLELDFIAQSERPTKRHGWKITKMWSRLSYRNSNMPRIDPPEDVRIELRKKINDAIEFC